MAAGLTIAEIVQRARLCQEEAIGHSNAGDDAAALRRISEGRELAEAGRRRAPEDAELLIVLGFLEKTQAQIDTDPDSAAASLSKAASCFAKALEAQPSDVSTVNGMANVYAIAHDYDRAIKLGETLFTTAPEYGAAAFDYALAMERHLEETGENLELLEKLDVVYRHLQGLLARPEQKFSAMHFAYVQERVDAAT